MAISVNRKMLSFFYILHNYSLGRNPGDGESPPNDTRMMRIRIVMRDVLFHVCDNDTVVVHELGISSKKTVLL